MVNTLDDGVRHYIDVKRNVLRNMGRIQNELARMEAMTPEGRRFVLQRIQTILDDPFAADGLPASS
jgi:hypothetical protein